MSQPDDPRRSSYEARRIEVPGGWIYHGGPLSFPILVLDPAVTAGPDAGIAKILAAINNLATELRAMSTTVDTTAAEVTRLQTNMTNLHAGIADIQTRLAAAIAAGAGSGDPAVIAELGAINTDLEAVVAGLAPAPPAPLAA